MKINALDFTKFQLKSVKLKNLQLFQRQGYKPRAPESFVPAPLGPLGGYVLSLTQPQS